MDLLKTLLIYMSMIFATSVQTAPEAMEILTATPEPTLYVAPATPTPAPTPVPTPVPTIDITPNPAYKTLQVGDRGDLVRAMQEKLIEYGYLQGEADGAYGNQTRMAVEAFQYQHGLSADGIAGRRTLTVLYESAEIRLSPSVSATPQPTAATQLTVAITPEPTETPAITSVPTETPAVVSAPTAEPVMTAAPTASPIVTPAPTETPVVTPRPTLTPTFIPVETIAVQEPAVIVSTPTPSPTPVPELEPLTDYAIRVSDSGRMLKAHPCRAGEMIYLPVAEILEAADQIVIQSEAAGKYEIAFARGENLIRLAYELDGEGEPRNFEFFIDTEPQVLLSREARRADGSLYLPVTSFETISGFEAVIDESASEVVISLSTAEKE